MFQHMPKNFPAGKARLDFTRKLQVEFDDQANLRQVFEPLAVTVRKFGPASPQRVKRGFRRRTLGKQPRSHIRTRAQTGEPDSFAIVNVAESSKNTSVRDAKIALDLLCAEC